MLRMIQFLIYSLCEIVTNLHNGDSEMAIIGLFHPISHE